MISPVSPHPGSHDAGKGSDHQDSEEEPEVDMGLAMLDDPIVGVEAVLSNQHGPGARPARPLRTPKHISPAQRAIHELTHTPFDERCEICAATRGLNAKHMQSSELTRVTPVLVACYRFMRWSTGTALRTSRVA